MGIFTAPFEFGDPSGERWERVEGTVDTGATYTFVPEELVQRLGAQQTRRPRTFALADGSVVERQMALLNARWDGDQWPTPVVVGEPGSRVLIGAVTLEIFGLAADPVNEGLVPARLYA